MMKKLYIYILFPFILFSQENFPVNGVKETNQVIHAYVNANIYINYNEKIQGATLIIKNNKILDVGKSIKIPKQAIIHDLTNFTICPSFIDIFTDYGQNEEIKNEQTLGSWNPALNIEYNAVNYFEINKNQAKKFINSGFGLVNSLK